MDVRSAAWVVLVCALGGLAASAALGQSLPVPLPTVSTPTVSVPSVTVPPVTVPPVSPPAPAPTPPPVSTPPATTPPAQVSGSGASVGGTGVSTGGAGGSAGGSAAGGAGGGGGTAASGSSASSPGGYSAGGGSAAGSSTGSSATLRSSRTWIAANGSSRRRTTTLTFRLRGNGIVRFSVQQLWPVCRLVGSFSVRGHAGANRVPFAGRVHGTQLAAGTYRITVRTRSGRVVAETTLVVVEAGAPSNAELALARNRNVCGASGVLGAAAIRGSLAVAVGAGNSKGGEEASTIVRHQRTSGKHSQTPSSSSDNGSSVASGALSNVSANAKSPIVIVLLGLAVLTLGLAALPRSAVADPRVMALVASHRLELATAGTAALFAAVVAMLIV
jgi:hypothetical protein